MSRPRKTISLTLLTVLASMLCCTFALGQSGSTAETLLFKASAYGSYAFVGQTVKLGKTAPVSIGGGCGTAQIGASRTGTVASVTLPPLIITGVVNTSASSSATQATATSDVHQVDLLAGLVKADEVMAVSTTSRGGIGVTLQRSGLKLRQPGG